MELDGSSLKPLPCDPAGRLAAEVVRTTVDPFLGRVCLVRVFSGTLREDSAIHIGGRGGLADRGHEDHDADERITHLYSPVGSSLKAIPQCFAGDICAISKLASAETGGDSVSGREAPLLIETWNMPEPLMPVAIEGGASRSDEDALAKSIGKVAAADPTLRLERNQDTHQLILWCMGGRPTPRLSWTGCGARASDSRPWMSSRPQGNLCHQGNRTWAARQAIRRPRTIRHL